jgi:MGT family glycosyltransferase
MYDSLAAWGRWASEILGVPGVASITTFVLTPSSMPKMPLGQTLRFARNIVRQLPPYMRVRSRLRRYKIRDLGLLSALMNTGPINLVFTSREIQPNGEALGSEYVFVGASIAERNDTLDIPLDGRPLIYVSLGTLAVGSREFFQQVFAALGDLPVQVVVSTGRQTDLADLTVPENVTLRPHVAQLEILKHAAVFITHAGLNSVHEGLCFGVPMLLVSQQMEQLVTALQIEKLGAGIMLPKTADASEMTASVQRLLATPGFKLAAARAGESLHAAGGAEAAADAIESQLQPAPQLSESI